MDGKDHVDREPTKNNICSLEWIAWAMEAARRHKEAEQVGGPPQEDPTPAEED